MTYRFSKQAGKWASIGDFAAIILALAAGSHFTFHAERIAIRIPIMDPLTNLDIVFGLVFVLLSLEAARRTIGFSIVLIALIGISYALWGHYFLPLIVLITFLLLGYSASRAGFYGILWIVLISWLRKNTRMGLKEIAGAMINGSNSSISVTTACAASGLVIAGIMSTGLGGKLTSIVLGFTEGMIFPTLLLIMLLCIILGTGMPVAAAYILTAMLAAPSLIELGVPVMAAHLFIVYFSVFSAITPPVAVAAFAAANIAETNPIRVGLEAVRLGSIGFIIPFMFVLKPSLLMDGPIEQIIVSITTALIGVILLASGWIGWFAVKSNLFERMLLITVGFLMMYPEVISDWMGVGLVIVVVLMQRKRVGSKWETRTEELSQTIQH
ncbi:hypothetical protein GCM10008983_07350 [Lentibacillus halophilus]|uniref:TRAP C4-dicarboxylate transport system permease DctM subunit domain-containing protein n=1 Tax=Lentibacillus halophilus TaxID=295065 RepID=A0ABP3IYG0_9BACI